MAERGELTSDAEGKTELTEPARLGAEFVRSGICHTTRIETSLDFLLNQAPALHPLESALFPDPDVSHDQGAKEHQHLKESEHSERLELHRPWEQEDGLDVEHNEQDGDDIEPDRVALTGIVHRIDAAFIRHQLGFRRVLRANDAGNDQRTGSYGERHQKK